MNLTRCGHCGANLAPQDLMQPGCRYCGTVLPHHARAAQQAELVTNMMADRNGNGIPDAFEGLLAGGVAPAAHVVSYQSTVVSSSGGPGQPQVSSQLSAGTNAALGFGAPHPGLQAHFELQQRVMKNTVRGVFIAVAVLIVIGIVIAVAATVAVLL